MENENSLVLEILKDYKNQAKRMFVLLLVIIGLWFATIGGFIWYINQFDYITDETELTTNNGNNNTDGNITVNGDIKNGNN